MIKIFY